MAATFLAFGGAVQAAGLGWGWALAAALLIYGMPGQMILVSAIGIAGETPGGASYGAPDGAPNGTLAAVPGAVAANARFLPMAVALSPWLGRGRWWALPFIAVTPWAMAMRRLPGMPAEARLPWFLGFGFTSWLVAGAATLLGHAMAPLLRGEILAMLLFVNPLYFTLILAGEARLAPARRAIIGGVCASPLILVLPTAWALLAAGLLGGTLAFLLDRRDGRR